MLFAAQPGADSTASIDLPAILHSVSHFILFDEQQSSIASEYSMVF